MTLRTMCKNEIDVTRIGDVNVRWGKESVSIRWLNVICNLHNSMRGNTRLKILYTLSALLLIYLHFYL